LWEKLKNPETRWALSKKRREIPDILKLLWYRAADGEFDDFEMKRDFPNLGPKTTVLSAHHFSGKPFVHQLLLGCFDGMAGDENDIVQFNIALGRPPAEIRCEKFVIHDRRPLS
jgi:hypothetical protein